MSQSPSQPRGVRFGSFEVSFPSRELRKNGVRISLPGQPFDILAILLERAGEVVTREELRQRLWPADTFVDFEHGVNNAVKKLRAALGDSADVPLYIETLARVGYRFIAPLNQAGSTSHPAHGQLGMRWKVIVPTSIAVAVLALTFVLTRTHQTHSAAAEPVRFEIPVPENATLSLINSFALSPDGRQLAFAAKGPDDIHRLWVRPLNSVEAHRLPGSESPDDSFFWSPDSRFIAFGAGGKLKKIDISGGSAQTLCDAGSGINGGSWNRDGVIIFGQNAGNGGPRLMRVSADGGTASPLTTLDSSRGEIDHILPSFLPDGRHFIYLNFSTILANRGIYVGSLDAKPEEQDSRQLLTTDFQAVYVPSSDPDSGHLLFLRDGTLVAQPFDARRLRLTAEPVTVAEQVGSFVAYGLFSASTNGVLVYRTTGGFGIYQLTWYDRQGKAVGKVGEFGLPFHVNLSPDGTRVAIDSLDPHHPVAVILLYDLLRGTTTRFTFGSSGAFSPVWSPDGSRIIFASNRSGNDGLYVKAVNGEQDEEILLKSDENMFPTSWSRDGRFLLYETTDPKKKAELWVLPLEGVKKPIPFGQTEGSQYQGYFSPDGHWVAYGSDESGRIEIYVRPFSADANGAASGAGPKWLISTGGGYQARWRADGKELYYVALDGKLMAVEVTTGQVFQAGIPKPLFTTPLPGKEFASKDVASKDPTNDDVDPYTLMDTAADGKRFLFPVKLDQPFHTVPFTVVQNWQAGLKK